MTSKRYGAHHAAGMLGAPKQSAQAFFCKPFRICRQGHGHQRIATIAFSKPSASSRLTLPRESTAVTNLHLVHTLITSAIQLFNQICILVIQKPRLLPYWHTNENSLPGASSCTCHPLHLLPGDFITVSRRSQIRERYEARRYRRYKLDQPCV